MIKYIIIFYLILLTIPIATNFQTKGLDFQGHDNIPSRLYPVIMDNQFGYIDGHGKLIIKPRFEDADDFQDGFARIKVNGKWGFINSLGEITIEPTFDDVNNFANGYAKIKKDNLYGFIDKSGKIVIVPQFEYVTDFSGDSIACFRIKGRLSFDYWGLINNDGKIIFNPTSNNQITFNEGLASVGVFFQGRLKYGFINTKGEYVIEPRFESVSIFGFQEGLCLVKDNPELNAYGFINKLGEYVIKPQYGRKSAEFRDGLATIQTEDKTLGYVDKSGKTVIESQFTYGGSFFNGLAWVSYSDPKDDPFGYIAKYGVIDKLGRFVINPRFYNPIGFSEGLAAVNFTPNNYPLNYGFINVNGETIIPPKFQAAQSFKGGFAVVKFKDEWGIVNKNGVFVSGSIIGDLIRIKKNNTIGYMNKDFEWVWRP